MELSSITQFFKRIRKNYQEFFFGLIVGLIMITLLMLIATPLLIFLGMMNLMISGLILIKLKTNPKQEKEKLKVENKKCPECGSTRRHYKNCSKGKKA